ncbi:hypothetical protein D8S78_10070 [Natrialba swarupiae]|nr:hypothetical protein [Natrialba swarupiae]
MTQDERLPKLGEPRRRLKLDRRRRRRRRDHPRTHRSGRRLLCRAWTEPRGVVRRSRGPRGVGPNNG